MFHIIKKLIHFAGRISKNRKSLFEAVDQNFDQLDLFQKIKCIKKFSLRAQVGSMARTKFLPIIPTNRRTPTTQRIRRSNKPAKTSSSLSMNDLNFHSGLSQVDKYYTGTTPVF